MRNIIKGILLTIVILCDCLNAFAQAPKIERSACDPSGEEILSAMGNFYNLPPHIKGVAIGGEVTKNARRIWLPSGTIPLTKAVERVGGVLPSASGLIYVVRLQGWDNPPIKLEVDLSEIKQGKVEDILLQPADLIFVPPVCKEGKVLPTRPLRYVQPQPSVRPQPGGNELPLRIPNKRNVG